LEIREANGDKLGALATRHNLEILASPTPSPDGKGSAGRRGFWRQMFKPILLAVVFLAVVVPLVWLLGPRMARNSAISPEPGELDFGNQVVQTSSEARTITLTNKGSATLIVSGISISGASGADYAVEREDCTRAPIAPGSSCLIEVAFKPTTA